MYGLFKAYNYSLLSLYTLYFIPCCTYRGEARRGWLSPAMLRFAIASEKQLWWNGIGNTSDAMRAAI